MYLVVRVCFGTNEDSYKVNVDHFDGCIEFYVINQMKDLKVSDKPLKKTKESQLNCVFSKDSFVDSPISWESFINICF